MPLNNEHLIDQVLSLIDQLEKIRDSHIIIIHSTIQYDTNLALYKCLQNLDDLNNLDILLYSGGGQINPARRLVILLHEYVDYFNVLIPHLAKSAATLLCLAAKTIIMGTMGEFSPIDPHFAPIGTVPSGANVQMSAEDILAFRDMAREWFEISREEDKLQILALLAQKVFPTTLASFFRSDKLVREIAAELLLYQNSSMPETDRQAVVDRLVSGYHAHDYVITRSDSKKLGLNIQYASKEEEQLMWSIKEQCTSFIEANLQSDIPIRGIVMSSSSTQFLHRDLMNNG